MGRRTIGRRLLTVLFLAGAFLAMCRSLGPWLADYDGWVCRSGDFHVAEGEALLHGIGYPTVSYSMPGFSIPDALLCGHASAGLQMLTRSATLCACAALVFWLGWLLYSEVCGGAAAFLFALLAPPTLSSDRWLYTLHVLLVACALVWRAKAPGPRRSLLLAAAIAMSLWVLSPLFLFPLALALHEWRRRSSPGWPRQMLGILLAPFLCLTPWLLMNWRLHHRLILFEEGRARSNIITGALGFVSTRMGDWAGWAGWMAGRLDSWTGAPGEFAADRSVLMWAAREVLHHPLRYLAACGQRAFYAASLHPALFVCGAAAAWAFRRRREHRQLVLLAGYFFAVHCLMSVEPKYFEPLLPLLAVLAAGAALSWLGPAVRGPVRPGAGLLCAVMAPLALLQLCAAGLVLAYPGRAAQDNAFERELTRFPQDPWLWAERGARLLAQGRPEPAAQDLARALALAPQRPAWKMRLAWAHMAQGGPGADLWDRLRFDAMSEPIIASWQAFRTVYLLRQGRTVEAQGALALLEAMWRPPASGQTSDIVAAEVRRAAQERLDIRAFSEALSCWPAPVRQDLSERLARLLAEKRPDGLRLTELWLQEASSAISLGKDSAALAALDLSQRYHMGPEQACRTAVFYSAMGERERALRVIRVMFAPRWKDFSAAQYRQGLTALTSWVERHPKDSGLLLAWAEQARAAGLADSAQEALRCASALEAPRRAESQDLGRLALSCQDRGEYPRALAILDGLIRAEPRQPRWRSDRGVVELLLGRRAAAAADWRQAILLAPEFLPPYLSLGSLYAARRQRSDALRLYETALRQPFTDSQEARALRERIRAERARLRSTTSRL